MGEIFVKVQDILGQYVDYPVESIGAETTFVKDLHMSSFDIITLLSELEDAYGITISVEQASELVTVGDLCAYVQGLTA